MWAIMVLSHNDQKNLIGDILKAHQQDGAARSSEYEQLYRSAASLLSPEAQTGLDVSTIQAIQSYGEKGMQLDNYDGHLGDNKENFQTWIDSLS